MNHAFHQGESRFIPKGIQGSGLNVNLLYLPKGGTLKFCTPSDMRKTIGISLFFNNIQGYKTGTVALGGGFAEAYRNKGSYELRERKFGFQFLQGLSNPKIFAHIGGRRLYLMQGSGKHQAVRNQHFDNGKRQKEVFVRTGDVTKTPLCFELTQGREYHRKRAAIMP